MEPRETIDKTYKIISHYPIFGLILRFLILQNPGNLFYQFGKEYILSHSIFEANVEDTIKG